MVSQVQEFQLILHEIHSEGMVLSEAFQVAAIIEKLPLGWKDFKNYLKHKRKEMNVEELIVRLRIEEDNKRYEKRGSFQSEVKANVVEHGQSSKFKKRTTKGSIWDQKEEYPRSINSKGSASIVTRWVTKRRIVDCRGKIRTRRQM